MGSGGYIIAKNTKKKVKKVKTDDDPIDLQSLISSLKDEPKEGSNDKESESTFEIIEEFKEEKKKKVPADKDLSKAKKKFEKERRMFEAEKADFQEQRKKTENYLKGIGSDILKKKKQLTQFEDQLRKKDSEQIEKQQAIKKATELLLNHRKENEEKEQNLRSLKEDLSKKAQELKKKEENLATFKDRTADLDTREIKVREMEENVKERELHLASMESQIADCPNCSSKDRFVSIERMIEELKEFGIHDDEADRDLVEMRSHIDSGETERAIEMGDKTIKRLKELRNEVLIKGIKYLLIGAESTLKHAKEVLGQSDSVEDAERWIDEARHLIEKEDYKSAEYYIKESQFLLQSLTRETSSSKEDLVSRETSKNYNCPSCYTTFTIDTIERPVRITCPGCQIELMIKEDVTFA